MALERKAGVGVVRALLEEGPGTSRLPLPEKISLYACGPIMIFYRKKLSNYHTKKSVEDMSKRSVEVISKSIYSS
jgi:hypothetical protein